ncbi:MAG: PHB depolymerase family esterase [Burkholderiaceae bacterium]
MKPNQILETIHRALDSAGLGQQAGNSGNVRDVIDRALKGAGLDRWSAPSQGSTDASCVTFDASEGQAFRDLLHSSEHGTRQYKLFVPSSYDGSPRPLIVMLHGCKQNPEDFAAGTQMNLLAQTHGILVAYPAQTPRANGGNCWNWFESSQQVRGGSEPSLIAGIVSDIGRDYALDQRKTFVAGLSAGAAMAVILGHTYPEVFSAVAAHSGLPIGAAHDVASAFAAMHGQVAASPFGIGARAPTRTIVFHGDADATVAPGNGHAITAQAIAAFKRHGTSLRRVERRDASAGTRPSTCTEYVDDLGLVQVEECVVRGGGHAWFGGNPKGSYTDPTGPDASREMVRFFLQDFPSS